MNEKMRLGITVSSVGHAAVLAWALIAWPSAESYEVPPMEAMPVDIVSIEEFTALKAGEREAEVKPAPKPVEIKAPEPRPVPEPTPEPVPEPPREVAALPPTPAPPAVRESAPEPIPEPTPPPPAQVPPEPQAQPEPSTQPEPEAPPAPLVQPVPVPVKRPQIVEQPRPETRERPPAPEQQQKPERSFEADRIAALLNKTDAAPAPQTPRQAEAEPAPDAQAQPETPAEPLDTAALGALSGTASELSMSELDYLREQISRCWSPPIGMEEAGAMVVRVRLDLNSDGSLMDSRVLEAPSDMTGQVASESALRAVRRCQPYDLPAEKYDSWQTVNINFDPREMLR
jgi:outer membrane biosynthesis protein TonB